MGSTDNESIAYAELAGLAYDQLLLGMTTFAASQCSGNTAIFRHFAVN